MYMVQHLSPQWDGIRSYNRNTASISSHFKSGRKPMKSTHAILSVVAITIAMSAAPAFAGGKGKALGKKDPLTKAVMKGKLPAPKHGKKLLLLKPGKL